jgi:hypothetical protein
LGSKRNTVRQECCWPSKENWNDTNSQSLPSLLTTQLSEFETPMNSSKERKNDGTVCDLDVLDGMEEG